MDGCTYNLPVLVLVLGLRRDAILLSERDSPQHQQQQPRALRHSQQLQAAIVATVVVRAATTTTNLGQLRRLPSAGDAARGHLSSDDKYQTEVALSFFWSDALLAACSFLCLFPEASLLRYIFLQHACLATTVTTALTVRHIR